MQYDQIKELIQIFEHSDLNNMEVTLGNASVKLGRGMANAVEESSEAQMVQTAVKVENPVTDAASTTVETEKTEPAAGDKIVTAPIVGTFYSAPSPEAKAFVKVGDRVKAGQTVCILEAMKLMNEIESDFDCEIEAVLVSNEQKIEYGQPLFKVKKIED